MSSMLSSQASPLDYLSGMKKMVTSSPTVTLIVTRIPSTITDEGMNNLFREFGTVLNLRFVVNKGGFAGVRGLNYAYVTLASDDEAVLAIGKLNLQPPLNLGVAYKPSEEVRAKRREQDLLDRALGSVKQEKVHLEAVEGADTENTTKDVFQDNNNDSEKRVSRDESKDVVTKIITTSTDDDKAIPNQVVFMFNSPLVVTMMDKKLVPCCCGNEATLVCSRCKAASYCSQKCQIAQWAGHREECGGEERGVGQEEVKGENDKIREVKKRKVGCKPSAGLQRNVIKQIGDQHEETSSARSTEDSPPHNTLSSGLSSSDKLENQDNRSKGQVTSDQESESLKRNVQHLNNDKADSNHYFVDLDCGQQLDDDATNNNLKADEIKDELVTFKCGEPVMMFKDHEKTEKVREGVFVCNEQVHEVVQTEDDDADKFDQSEEKVDDIFVSADESEESSSPFQSFLMFNKQSEEKVKVKLDISGSDREEFKDISDDVHSVGKLVESSPDTLPPHSPPSTLPSPLFPLPTTWTRVISAVPAFSTSTSGMFHVKIQGEEQQILVRLFGVRLAEPWSGDVMEIVAMVLGDGREGQVKLWVRNVGWEEDVQLVYMKDQEDNDIATLLSNIGVMERTIVVSVPPSQPQTLFARDLVKGVVVDGTLVRLRDIGDSSQWGLIRCMEEKERAWLEEVMELSDHRTSILSPQVGQLVAFVLQTKAGTRVARAEVIKVNNTNQKAFCQCLDYHDRRLESNENLFHPPPACLSIHPLCVKVELYGVPQIARKVAKVKLEQVDQVILSQPLTLHVKKEGIMGQVVELMDMEGNSINQLLASVLGGEEDKIPDATISTPQGAISSFLMSPDYSLLTSYVSMPLNTCLPATILHVESPTHLFVCPAANWEELNIFQAHLQSLAVTTTQVSTFQSVVGQLVMVRSEQDNNWYRGTIIKLQKTKAKIYCPDYGFVEKISLTNIQPLLDVGVARAKYWATHCTLVDWGEGEQEATKMEVEKVNEMLMVSQQVELQVVQIEGVKFIVDIKGINRLGGI